MTNKTILQTAGWYETPSCELLEVSVDAAFLVDSLGAGIESYSDGDTIEL